MYEWSLEDDTVLLVFTPREGEHVDVETVRVTFELAHSKLGLRYRLW